MDSLSPAVQPRLKGQEIGEMLVHVSTLRSASRDDDGGSTGRTKEKQQPTKTEAVEITYMCAHVPTHTRTHTDIHT
jgi:hypothetical protein